ncbi:MAG: NAD(P)-binding protein [Tissierellia bacterium]|nr:NAD(P)-binding protein [Tissierellia bacterium]
MARKDERIAIIGGGFSGLVIGDGLQRKGYKNVTIFEKETRLGGKLHSIFYRGKSYELGAIFGLPTYSHLDNLMKRLGIKVDGPKLSRTNYNSDGQKVMPIAKEELGGFLEEMDRLPKVLSKYKSLESASIKGLEPSLMVPFSEWCDMHDFKVLKTIYLHYFTIFGLGDIDEVPALYVLRIMSYEHLMCFMKIPQFYTWKEGTSTLADHLGQGIKDIRLGQGVKDISKSALGSLQLETQYEVLEFDKLIITAPLDQFSHLGFWEEDIRECLRSIKYQDFNVYAFIVDKVPKGCGCILDNLDPNRKGHIIIWDSRWNQPSGEGMVTLYAYNPPKDSRKPPLDYLKDDLARLGIKSARLYQAKAWKHCPYVDTQTLQNGFYDKMEASQGRNNIYFAGEVMSMLSIENTIWYANDLLDRFF